MKKLITIALAVIAINASAQITLEHDYQKVLNCQIFKLEIEGSKFVTLDTATKKVMIYNADHTLWKTVNTVLPAGAGVYSIVSCVSEHFFDSDDKVELLYSYLKSTGEWQTDLYKEDGTIMMSFPGAITGTAIKINGDWKLMTTSPYSYKVYSVPGEYTGSTMIKPQTGNGTEASLYPNPMESSAMLSYSLPAGTQQGNLNIYNASGVLVKQMTITNKFKEVLIGRDDLPAGVYVYQVTAPNAQPVSKQFVIR